MLSLLCGAGYFVVCSSMRRFPLRVIDVGAGSNRSALSNCEATSGRLRRDVQYRSNVHPNCRRLQGPVAQADPLSTTPLRDPVCCRLSTARFPLTTTVGAHNIVSGNIKFGVALYKAAEVRRANNCETKLALRAACCIGQPLRGPSARGWNPRSTSSIDAAFRAFSHRNPRGLAFYAWQP
jgi:hypothetical protein